MSLTDDLVEILRESNVRVVFYVCADGCQGRIEWTKDCRDAKCMVCGKMRSDFTCSYCGGEGHTEDRYSCPDRILDAERFSEKWKENTKK